MEQISHGAIDPKTLAAGIRRAGLKATPQRLAIYGALMKTTEHPTIEAIHQDVLAALPALPLGTVYKTVESLEEAGLVMEVSLPGNAKRYDANVSPHHHLVCTSCHRVTDFRDEALDALQPRVRWAGFRPCHVKVQVHGICASCQHKGPTGSA
jgi:Fur family transcriptional regulator, peroxide stress response regulator